MNQDSRADVAVIDDDHTVLEAIMDLLASAGLTARRFSSAREFLESDALDSIACLVSDIRMPGMDGWELQSIVAARRPALPVILITAHATDKHPAAHSTIAPVVFSKPFDAQALLSAITSALRKPTA